MTSPLVFLLGYVVLLVALYGLVVLLFWAGLGAFRACREAIASGRLQRCRDRLVALLADQSPILRALLQRPEPAAPLGPCPTCSQPLHVGDVLASCGACNALHHRH